MYRHELADPARGGGAGVGGGLHRRDIAPHDGGDVTGADLLPTDKGDFRGLDHRVGRFDHRDQPLGFNHPERLTHSGLLQDDSRRPPPILPLPQALDGVLDERGEFAVC